LKESKKTPYRKIIRILNPSSGKDLGFMSIISIFGHFR